ncbi:MAG: ATP-binding protein [Bacteroidetes bacterium]|nr:MAG: ATP-binding protein [Bacteroidota bacterium]
MKELRQLIQKGENETLDFKQEISSASKIAKTIVSFANRKGGRLLIGIRDNKSIAGVRTEDEKYMLTLASDFYCKPPIELVINEWELDGKVVLEAIVPEGPDKPYYAKDDDGKWWVYVRVKDQSLLASKIVVDVLKREAAQKDTLIQITSKEQALLDYLAKNHKITLKQYCKLINISRWRASKILVTLISAGIIRSHNTEKIEFYTLS